MCCRLRLVLCAANNVSFIPEMGQFGVWLKRGFYSINNMGYSAARSQALSAPPYVFACVVTLFSGWAADRYRQRMLSLVLPNVMALM